MCFVVILRGKANQNRRMTKGYLPGSMNGNNGKNAHQKYQNYPIYTLK